MSRNIAEAGNESDYSRIFWLLHSQAIADFVVGCPTRVAEQLEVESPRPEDSRPDTLKYRLLSRYLDRLFPTMYEVAEEVARDEDAPDRTAREQELFPPLLSLMRDNLLILSELDITPDLSQLDSYLRGYLGLESTCFRRRIEALMEWETDRLGRDPDMQAAVGHLLREADPQRRQYEPGYLSYLSRLRDYDSETMLSAREVVMWERLVLRLKEFELLDAYRHLVVRLRPEADGFRHERSSVATAASDRRSLFTRTRPIDFMAPWVVDPEVSRGGLIYDITAFTATVSRLGRDDPRRRAEAYHALVRFQRRIDRMARSLRVRFEKYLGDGAFYTGIDLRQLVIGAIALQREYRAAVAAGFPFDSGMRVAVNYGDYRLMPFGDPRTGDERYEAFGQGVVELTRLVSGKSRSTLRDLTLQLRQEGYTDGEIEAFFSPLAQREKERLLRFEDRPFRAFLDSGGHLVNEGIVATQVLLEELERARVFESHGLHESEGRRFVAALLADPEQPLVVGIRKLGEASLKGIDGLTVYELVDGQEWPRSCAAGSTEGLTGLLESTYDPPSTTDRKREYR